MPRMTLDLALTDAEDPRPRRPRLVSPRWCAGSPGRPSGVHNRVEALAGRRTAPPGGTEPGSGNYRVDRPGSGRRDPSGSIRPTSRWRSRGPLAVFLALRDALNRSRRTQALDRTEVQIARYPGDGAAYNPPPRRLPGATRRSPPEPPRDGDLLRQPRPGAPRMAARFASTATMARSTWRPSSIACSSSSASASSTRPPRR